MNNAKRNLEMWSGIIGVILSFIVIYLAFELVVFLEIDEFRGMMREIRMLGKFLLLSNCLQIIFGILMIPTFKRGSKYLAKLIINIPMLVLLIIDFFFFLFVDMMVFMLIILLAIVLLIISLCLKHDNFNNPSYNRQTNKHMNDRNYFYNEDDLLGLSRKEIESDIVMLKNTDIE